ncbi:type II toxin-antitoxin system RelE/ParE family toxin [Actinomycetota bacterium]
MVKKYKVLITKITEEDIRYIFEYILIDNPKAAERWKGEIKSQIASLKEFPLRCSIIPGTGDIGIDYRHIIYGDYRTVFKIRDDAVFIMRVFHCSRLLDLGIFGK